jgi:DNA-binding protein HU-beta
MNQQELVDAVAEAIGTTKADAGKAVAAVLDAIRDSLKRGEKVALSGFGIFETAERGPRKGRNIHTGEVLEIPAGPAAEGCGPGGGGGTIERVAGSGALK